MQPRLRLIAASLVLLFIFSGAVTPQAREKRDPVVGQRIAPFILPDSAGKQVGSADLKDPKAVVVIFLGTQCPVGNAYLPILLELHKQYHDKGVHFLGINANTGDK